MQLISCHQGQLQRLSAGELASARTRTFRTGLRSIDELLPGQAFSCGCVHEVLAEQGQGLPLFFAAVLARSAEGWGEGEGGGGEGGRCGGRAQCGGAIVWCDPEGRVYPPALAAAGIPLDRVLLTRPRNEADELWSLTECLRCPGVSVTVGSPKRLSRTEARRLQLAAESGGGVGILLRMQGRFPAEYAAGSRWLVRPLPGERTLQRWMLQLIHCHGGRVGRRVVLEACRETNTLRAAPAVADRSVSTGAERKRA